MSDKYAKESNFAKFWRKSKQAPFVPIGIVGLIGAVTYGGISYKYRGTMKTSVFIMQYRVIAQTMVVGAITIGVAATILPKIYHRIVLKFGDKKSE